jgi:protein required for attachment to host cells
MNSVWIVSANAGRAIFFLQEDTFESFEKERSIKKVGEMVNDKSSLHTYETETDRLGQHSASKSRHSVGAPTQPSGYEPNQTPAEHNSELFARKISQYLTEALDAGRFQRLALVASPEFLGVLRSTLDSRLTAIIDKEVNKDYTHYNLHELTNKLLTVAA